MGYGTDDRKKAVELFQADHQCHTTVVHRMFQSFFVESTTSPFLKATLKTVGVKMQ
jgi:hypothetical protein